MFKKIISGFSLVFILASVTGCVALIAAGAGGTGTAYWLSNKLVQEVNASYEKTISAAESALKSLNLALKKKTVAQTVPQIRSEYRDGKDIWIDIRRICESTSRLEVRVGAVSADEQAADRILKRIVRYL